MIKFLKDKLVTIILVFVAFITILTIYHWATYFFQNEILFSISKKYNTIAEPELIKEIVEDSLFTIKSNIELNNETTSLPNGEKFELGDIGDFIGGFFGFYVGIIGALLTFLAFYVQFRANRDVQRQFRIQQFENQFNKMLEVYLNNKDKFSITGYKNPNNQEINFKTYKGNSNSIVKGFDKILNEKRQLLSKANKQEKNIKTFIDYETKNNLVFQKLLVELKVVNRLFIEAYKEVNGVTESSISSNIKRKLFSNSYILFYYGLNKYRKDYKRLHNLPKVKASWADKKINDKVIKRAIEYLDKIKEIHKLDGTKIYYNFYISENSNKKHYKNLWVRLNYEPFRGYLHFLPQYYRNLFSIVNFVVMDNEDLNLTKEQKLKYLKILRSTVSDYEQAMLFYNWYSGIGIDWENKVKNSFFTDYKMIHNMQRILLIDDQIDICQILGIEKDKIDEIFENY
ncbi:putative phage abortive infection protein [Myroides odoratus]|uniref:putative phage abortive infection protein n=1 Tax=Myroides odoratimimus TaxID=76832 RepID=UPI0031013703